MSSCGVSTNAVVPSLHPPVTASLAAGTLC
jgi:hypothetical protein